MQGERASTIAPFIMPTAYLQMDKRKDIAIRRPPLYDAQDIRYPYGGYACSQGCGERLMIYAWISKWGGIFPPFVSIH